MIHPSSNGIFIGTFLFRHKASFPMVVAHEIHRTLQPFFLPLSDFSVQDDGLYFVVAVRKNIGLNLYLFVDYPLDGILSAVDQRSYIFYIDPFLSFQFFHIGEFQYFFFKIVNSVAFGIRIIQRKNVPNCLNQNPIYTFPLLHMCAVSFLVGIIMNGYLLKSLLSE